MGLEHSHRQRDVAQGRTVAEITDALGLSKETAPRRQAPMKGEIQ